MVSAGRTEFRFRSRSCRGPERRLSPAVNACTRSKVQIRRVLPVSVVAPCVPLARIQTIPTCECFSARMMSTFNNFAGYETSRPDRLHESASNVVLPPLNPMGKEKGVRKEKGKGSGKGTRLHFCLSRAAGWLCLRVSDNTVDEYSPFRTEARPQTTVDVSRARSLGEWSKTTRVFERWRLPFGHLARGRGQKVEGFLTRQAV